MNVNDAKQETPSNKGGFFVLKRPRKSGGEKMYRYF